MKKISVLLAEDHVVVRQGLRSLLSAEADIEVVGEAGNGRLAVKMAQELRPDVVVMDIAMPMLNGLEATCQIIGEGIPTRVLILSSYADDEYVHQLTEAGASGYLIKQSAASELIRAVREIARGNAYFSPPILKRLLELYREFYVKNRKHGIGEGHLTGREQEVLQMVAEGYVNKQIAAALSLSIKTVEKHRQQLMDKLNIHDIAGLTRYAVAHGVVESTGRIRGVAETFEASEPDASAEKPVARRQIVPANC
jgi:DNA-binding NarL/FixJ family response regulator